MNTTYWLLLHFEEGSKISNGTACLDAIQRSKQRNNPACVDWPRTMGVTTVYKLVERLVPKGNAI